MTGRLATVAAAPVPESPPAALEELAPRRVLEWLDNRYRFPLPDRLAPATLTALPEWIEAARADCAPAGTKDIAALFKLLSAALPPQFGMREAAALPLYIRNLGDLPAKALPHALDDLLCSMTHFPTIAHIREAARPHAGMLYLRRHRLERLLAANAEAEARGWPLGEAWNSIR